MHDEELVGFDAELRSREVACARAAWIRESVVDDGRVDAPGRELLRGAIVDDHVLPRGIVDRQLGYVAIAVALPWWIVVVQHRGAAAQHTGHHARGR